MAKPKTTKGRSEEGRNESKRGKVAGKGFVVAKTTKSERKAAGKALGKVAAAALPGGLGVKAATKVAKAATKTVRARRSGRAAVATSQKAGPSRSTSVGDGSRNEKISLRRSLDTAEESLKKANKQADDKLAKFWNNRIKSINNKLNELRNM